MNATARTRRLLLLYLAQERAAEARLQVAGAELQAATNLKQASIHAMCLSSEAGRLALLSGDTAEHQIRQQVLLVGHAQAERLQAAIEKLQVAQDEAAATHRASRMESAQMQQLADETMRTFQQESGRREQAESDDRFASRLRPALRMTDR